MFCLTFSIKRVNIYSGVPSVSLPVPGSLKPSLVTTGLYIFCWFIILYFPTQSTTASSSGTARLDQPHSMSQE